MFKDKNLLKNRNFVKLWSSQIFSQLTINILNFTLITYIYEKTGSTTAVALLWVFYGLPAVFVGLFSGLIIDLWDKRKVLILTNLLQAITVFIYLLIKKHLYLVYLIVFLYSFLNQFYLPAEFSSLPWLVKKKRLPVANSLFLFTSQIAFLVGFGSGGVFVKFLGRSGTILSAGFLLLLATTTVFLLPQEKKRKKLALEKIKFNFWLEKLNKSWQFLSRKGKLVLYSFSLLALFQVFAGALATIFPAFSSEILNRPFTDTSLGLVLPASLGLIIGSWLFSRSAEQKRKKQWIIDGILILGLGLLTIAFIPLFPFSFQQKFIFIIFLLLILGGAAALVFVPCQTFIQETTPPDIRGRIFGLMSLVISLGTIPPVLFIAAITDILGVGGFLSILGAGALFLAVFLRRRSDEIILAANHRH